MIIRRIDKLSINIVYELALYSILLLLTFSRILGDGFKYAQYTILCGGVFLTCSFLAYGLKKIKVSVLMVFALVFGFAVINKVFVGAISIIEILMFGVIAFGVGVYLYYSNIMSIKLALCMYIISTAALVIINHSNSDTYYLFEGLVSRNYISIFTGLWLFIVVLAYSKQQKTPPLFVYFYYFFASVVSVGRMGILCSGLLLFLVLFDRYVKPSIHITRGFIVRCVVFGAVVLAVSVFVFKECYWLIEQIFSRFVDPDNIGSNYERRTMLIQYLMAMSSDVKSFVFGLKTEMISQELYQHNGNTHNCFFMIHSRTGIISVGVIIFSMLYTIWRNIKNGKKELAFISLAILLRGLTDQFMIGDIGDLLIGFCLLNLADNSNNRISHEQ